MRLVAAVLENAFVRLEPLEGVVMGVNYGFDKLRFLAPVLSGSQVRGRF